MSASEAEVEYHPTIFRLDGRPIPTNACYYCGSREGPFEPFGAGDEGFKKCKGGCGP